MGNNNIFEGAEFGDKFVTRDGRKAMMLSCHYSEKYCALSIEDDTNHYYHLYNKDGSVIINWKFEEGSFLDIVSRYQEPIDEEKLDELAGDYGWKNGESLSECTKIDKAYKAGYRRHFMESTK